MWLTLYYGILSLCNEPLSLSISVYFAQSAANGSNTKETRRQANCSDLGFYGRARDVRNGVFLRFGARIRGDHEGRGEDACIFWLSGNHGPCFGTTASRSQSEKGDTQVPSPHHDNLCQGTGNLEFCGGYRQRRWLGVGKSGMLKLITIFQKGCQGNYKSRPPYSSKFLSRIPYQLVCLKIPQWRWFISRLPGVHRRRRMLNVRF